MPPPAISLTHVSKTFHDHAKGQRILQPLSLDIAQGEFFVFLGPSGCGKSTLLRLMGGLDASYQGRIDRPGFATPEDIGFVFQQFALLPWLTVKQNISLNLLGRQIPAEKHSELIHAQLHRFHLEKFEDSYPKELSGGQRQRVGLARALVAEPKVIFMDEPFSELDTATANELREQLLDIWQQQKPTIIMVTHLIPEAIELADRIAVISHRPGSVKDIITNTLPRPRLKRSQEFFTLEDKLNKMLV